MHSPDVSTMREPLEGSSTDVIENGVKMVGEMVATSVDVEGGS